MYLKISEKGLKKYRFECCYRSLLKCTPGSLVSRHRHETPKLDAAGRISVKNRRRPDLDDGWMIFTTRPQHARPAIRNPFVLVYYQPHARDRCTDRPTATENHAVLNSRHGRRNGFDTPPAISAFPPTRQSRGAHVPI